jgi:hypothetical protein
MSMARIACCFSTNEFLLEIHMVSGVMLVKGYSMRQQSAIMVSEYLPSFKTQKSKSTREERPTMSLLSIVQETSVKYSEPSCNVYG